MQENNIENAQTSRKTANLRGFGAASAGDPPSSGALKFTNVTGFGPFFRELKRSRPN
jgi:hypothetical protein